MKKKSAKDFTASNGVTVGYTPDADTARPVTTKERDGMERVNVKDILSPEQMQALSEFTASRVRGRPKKDRPKVNATLRMDAEVLDTFRASGKGWQSRINTILREWITQHPQA